MKHMPKHIILLAAVLTIIPGVVFGRSAKGLVEQGNLAYGHKKFDEALKFYRQAAKQAPDSPYVQFDLGNALYKKGDFKGALSAYEQAAAKSRDPQFIGKNKFNQGNAVFRQAEAKQQGDPQAALQGMNDSLHYYREAMALDPDLISAAMNIEVAKDRINKVKKELARKEAQRQAAEKARKEMAKKLKQMVQEQQSMASRSRQQAAGKKENKGEAAKQKAAQQDLRAKTKKMADQMAGQQKRQGPSKDLAKAAENLNKALDHQDKALDALKNKAPAKASAAQEKAAKNMRQALASLQDHDKTKKPSEGKKGGATAGQKKSAAQQAKKHKTASAASGKKGQPKGQAGEQGKPFKLKNPPDQTAEDLLNEERQHDLMRQQEQSKSRYEAVDKNW